MKKIITILLALLISSCSVFNHNTILNHNTDPKIEKVNRKKRAVIGLVFMGAMIIVTINVIDKTKNPK